MGYNLSIIMADNTKTLLDQLKDDSILNNVDDIIDELKTGDNPQPDEKPEPLNLNEEDLGKFILEHAGRLIQDSTALVTRLKKTVGASGDPEEIAALADLVASTSTAIETVNKIYTQNKKIQAAKELKQQEIEGKKEVAKIKSGDGNQPQGILVATREEIFARLLDSKRGQIIDVKAEDLDEEAEKSDVEETMEITDKDSLGPA